MADVKCMAETIAPGTGPHPNPPGPWLLLDFDKIVLLLGDRSSTTTGNPRARDWMRDPERRRIISFWLSKEDMPGA